MPVAVFLAVLGTMLVPPAAQATPFSEPRVAGAAQATPVAGTWRVTWDSDIRSKDGEVQRVIRRSTAQLILSQRGDSVEGRWIDGLLEEEPSSGPGVPVRGTIRGDTLVMTTGRVRTSRGGIRVSLFGVRSGAALAGQMYVELAGLPAAPRKWEGTRLNER